MSTTPTLTGTADPGSVIAIYQDGVLVPLTNVVADVNGNWSYTPLLPLTEGPHTFAVTATNTTTGATSGQSPIATVTVDLTAPTAPAIGAVTDDVGSDNRPNRRRAEYQRQPSYPDRDRHGRGHHYRVQ